jgi:acetolactate synthase-1/2/3 large subunit
MRHEQACAYMADGYTRSTGETAMAFVVPGPGLLNASAALSTAYACSSPVLCVTGQINSDLIGVGRGVLHEINDQLETISSVTKWQAAWRPKNPGYGARSLPPAEPAPAASRDRGPPDILRPKAMSALRAGVQRALAGGRPVEKAAEALGQAKKPHLLRWRHHLGSRLGELQGLAELLERR